MQCMSLWLLLFQSPQRWKNCSSVDNNVLLHLLAQYDYSNHAFWKFLFIYCATVSTKYIYYTVNSNYFNEFLNRLAFLRNKQRKQKISSLPFFDRYSKLKNSVFYAVEFEILERYRIAIQEFKNKRYFSQVKKIWMIIPCTINFRIIGDVINFRLVVIRTKFQTRAETTTFEFFLRSIWTSHANDTRCCFFTSFSISCAKYWALLFLLRLFQTSCFNGAKNNIKALWLRGKIENVTAVDCRFEST